MDEQPHEHPDRLRHARAAFLRLAGEHYIFTNAPPNTNAPLWWVSTPPLSGYSNGSNSVIATLPATHHGDQSLLVPLLVTPSDSIYVHAIEDAVPAGWTVLTISHGGNYDSNNRKVKWGPFFDAGQRDLAYTAQPPAGSGVTFIFTAQASFDGYNLAAPVARSVQLITEASNALRFTTAQRDAQGSVFTLLGTASTAYVLEVSTNLTTWTSLETITTDATGQYAFRPTNSTQSARGFFRARTP